MLLTLEALLAAATIARWPGETRMSVVTRVLGILLTALSAEMIPRGLKESGIFLRAERRGHGALSAFTT